ncbi:MAG TPA: thioredoxin family protein [Steroidobacteraceae bacterium]|jgi:protein disulfide-isomerase|nr:thioredoxin family protein [Steroidobacteraceae bacterium]
MKSLLSMLAVLSIFGVAVADVPLPYEDPAQAHAALSAAVNEAKADHKDVLIVFGANWCEDCRALDQAMHGSSEALVNSHLVVAKVNVGNFDANLDIAKQYGNPIAKGIPAAVVATPDGKVLYSTKAGELANARRMSEHGIYDFFNSVVLPRASP